MCPKHAFGHTYKISAWNSYKKYNRQYTNFESSWHVSVTTPKPHSRSTALPHDIFSWIKQNTIDFFLFLFFWVLTPPYWSCNPPDWGINCVILKSREALKKILKSSNIWEQFCINSNLSVYAQDIFVWNFKGYLWNSIQISYPYSERCVFGTEGKFEELLD